MKKIFVVSLICYSLFASDTLVVGDPDKGQIYFKYFIAPIVNLNGAVFTKTHTVKEWQERFSNDGKLLFEEFKIDNKMIDKSFLNHLEAFCIRYAKDSDITPNCGE